MMNWSTGWHGGGGVVMGLTVLFRPALDGLIVGRPFRLRPLRQAIKHCVEHKYKDRVWFTRAGDIAKYCSTLPKGIIPGS